MKRNALFVCAALMIVGATCATAQAQDATLYACADSRGRLRVVSSPSECNSRETLVSWNAFGQPGSAGIRVLDSANAPQQVGHWLGVMNGHARVGFHVLLPTGEALNMSLPVAPGGFIQGDELFFQVDSTLVLNAFVGCQSQQQDLAACLAAAFDTYLAQGLICQDTPFLPAEPPDPLAPTAFFSTTTILGGMAELHRADLTVPPTSIAFILPGSSAKLVFPYDPNPIDPDRRCTWEIRADAPTEGYPTQPVLSLYSVFVTPFRIRID